MRSPRKVFISHTSEMSEYPLDTSFIAAAVEAVNRALDTPVCMNFYSAHPTSPIDTDEAQVSDCDVYVGIIGFQYGSLVREDNNLSYTEHEYYIAKKRGMPRLIFMLDEDAVVPASLVHDLENGDRQRRFREFLNEDGNTTKAFHTSDELEKLVFQALKELNETKGGDVDTASLFQGAVDAYVEGYEKNSKTHRKYVELNATSSDGMACGRLITYVDSKANSDHNAIVVLGEFGTGKTAFCGRYAYIKSLEFQRKPENSRIPLLFRLRDFRPHHQEHGLVKWMVDELLRKAGIKISIEVLVKLSRTGQLIFILDGFDEMGGLASDEVLLNNLREITGIARNGSPVVLTCRTTFFDAEVEGAMQRDFLEVHINAMNRQQVAECAKKQFSENWEKFVAAVERQPIVEIAERPLFLNMLQEVFGNDERALTRVQNVSQLYGELSDNWIAKESVKHMKINVETRRQLIQDLAYLMFLTDEYSFDRSGLADVLNEIAETSQEGTSELVKDMANCGFLDKGVDGQFEFAHKSFMEYFVAKKISNELKRNSLSNCGKKTLYEEIFEFMAQILDGDEERSVLTRTLDDREATFVAKVNVIVPIRKQRNQDAIRPLLKAHMSDSHPFVRYVCGYTVADLGRDFSQIDFPKEELQRSYRTEGNSLVRMRTALLISKSDGLRPIDVDYSVFPECDPNYDFPNEDVRGVAGGPGVVAAYERIVRVNRESYIVMGESVRLLTLCLNTHDDLGTVFRTVTDFILYHGYNHPDESIRWMSIWSIGRLGLLAVGNPLREQALALINSALADARAPVQYLARSVLEIAEAAKQQ